MKLLNVNSLIDTIDRINEAVFFERDWIQEAPSIADWISGRLGKKGGYAGSFAMTESDWASEFRLFTGEKLTTRAGRAHVIAEETTRIMKIIENRTDSRLLACEESERRLSKRIFQQEGYNTIDSGEYCCGTCSVALWRCIIAGGFGMYFGTLHSGLANLSTFRKATSGWNRFPFYYTMLALWESQDASAIDEISHHMESCSRRIKTLGAKKDKYSFRKLELIKRIVK